MIVTVVLTCLAMTVSTIPVTPDTGLVQQTHVPAQNLPPAVDQASSHKPAPQILVQIQPNVQQQQPQPPPLQPGVWEQQQGMGPQGGPQFLPQFLPHHQPWVPQHGGVQLMMPYHQPNFQGPPPQASLPTQQQQQQQQQPMMFSPYGYYPAVFSPPQGNQLYNPYGFPMIFQSPQVPQSPPNQPAVSPVAPPAEITPSGPTGAAAAANTRQPPEGQQNHHQIVYMFQQPMTSQFGGLSSEELEVAARLSMFLPSAAAAMNLPINANLLPNSGRPSLGLPHAAGLLPSEAGQPNSGMLPDGNNAAPVGLESSGQNPPASLPGAAVVQPNDNHQTPPNALSRSGTVFEATRPPPPPPPVANSLPRTTRTTAMEVNDMYHP